MPAPIRLAMLGLSETERALALAALAAWPGLAIEPDPEAADWLLADAEHTPSVKWVLAAGRLARTVWVGTPPPDGSVGVVDRPLQPAELATALARLLPPATPPKRALLVDDSEIALRFLQSRLQRWGLVMDLVTSSNQAIERMAHGHYDFVFVDVELGPQSSLDGFALAQHIRRQHAREMAPPLVVMVSAHASPSDRARGQLAGCDAFLGKPLDEVELQRLLLRHGLKPRAATPSGAA